jgi:phospholipid/cholesterol/gamma-HCH transport system substrate-binding protein
MTELPRAARAVIGAALVVVMVAGSTLLVKLAYGAFSPRYPLSGLFSEAGQGLHVQSEVQYRGVDVGAVSSITLYHHRALVGMKIDSGFRIPADAVATISPKNVFGEDTISFSFPRGNDGPYLADGARVRTTAVDQGLIQLLAAADPLLNAVNGVDLATVISELARASQGQGPQIAASIEEGTKLANLLDATLQGQIRALDSFTAFSQALAPAGPSLNAISTEENVALPAFDAQAAAYQRLLTEFTPVANDLASLLQDYHPDITAMLSAGVNVSRVLIADQADISNVVHGLYRYTLKFSGGSGPEVLPNGTRFAFFKTFILFPDVNTLVCDLIAPPQPGLSSLEPLQAALTGSGSPFNCSAQLAAFRAAQAGSAGAAAGAGTPSVLAPVRRAAQSLANGLGAVLGHPQTGAGPSLSSLLGRLAGSRAG